MRDCRTILCISYVHPFTNDAVSYGTKRDTYLSKNSELRLRKLKWHDHVIKSNNISSILQVTILGKRWSNLTTSLSLTGWSLIWTQASVCNRDIWKEQATCADEQEIFEHTRSCWWKRRWRKKYMQKRIKAKL